MKTKHILTALALPALFAACTADEIESVSKDVLQERAVLSENFKLGFNGVESRLTAGEPDGAFEFDFEKNDTVGGAIVDAFNAEGKLEVVNYVSTNHPFVKSGDDWTINHTMVEGSYLFYYPYNQNNNSRSAVVYEIPVMQDLSDVDGTFNRKAAIEKYVTAVGFATIDKDDLSAYPDMRPINSYARIVAKFDNRYAGGEVDKVVLQTTDDETFTVKGQISNVKLAAIQEAVLEGDKKWSEVKDVKEVSILAGDAFYNDELVGRESTVLVGKVPAGVKMKVDAQNNKSFETYMVVPAQSLEGKMNVYLYLTDGRVFVGNTSVGGITFNRHTPKKVEVDMDETDEVPFVITSMKDWNLYASEVSKNTTAVFEIASPDFVLTNDAKYPTAAGATIKVTTDLTIAGDDVTLKNVVSTSKIIVKEGAKLTTDVTLVAKEIENYGEVVVAPVKDEEGDYVEYNLGGYEYSISKAVTTYTVCKPNLPKGELGTKKDGTITNMPGATLEIAENAIARAKVVNMIDAKHEEMAHGVVTVNGTAVLVSGSENSGEVVNNGSMTGAFTNNAELPYEKNTITFEEEEDYIYFTPSLTNNGEIFANKAWTNNGKIDNKKGAEISVSKIDDGAKFDNAGQINLADGSFCLISTSTGEIVLSVLNQENWSVNANTGTVSYTTSTADAGKSYDFTTTGKNITKIYLNGSLGVTKIGNIKTIEVISDATISMPKEGTIANLTVKSGVAAAVKSVTDADGTEHTANFTNVVVEKKATLTVNEGHNLACTTVSNEGTVYVGGSFTASGTVKDDAGEGKFKTTSTSGNITFKSDTADADAVEAAKVKVFSDFIESFLGGVAPESTFGADKYFETWADVTSAKIWGFTGGWTDETSGFGKLAKEFIKAYNEKFGLTDEDGTATEDDATDDAKTIADFGSVLKAEANKAYFEAGVAAVKTASDAEIGTTIKAVIKDNTWFNKTTVYEVTDEDYTINDVKSGSTKMIDAFVLAVKAIECTNDEVKEADNVVPGNVWLSLQSVASTRYYYLPENKEDKAENYVEANTTEIPDYSYIQNYEGSYLYKVLKLMKEFSYTAPKENAEKWQTALAAAASGKAANIAGVIAFYNEVYKVYKNADAALTDDLVLGPKVKAIADEAATVVTWKYTDAQIVKAVIDGKFGTALSAGGAEFN